MIQPIVELRRFHLATERRGIGALRTNCLLFGELRCVKRAVSVLRLDAARRVTRIVDDGGQPDPDGITIIQKRVIGDAFSVDADTIRALVINREVTVLILVEPDLKVAPRYLVIRNLKRTIRVTTDEN